MGKIWSHSLTVLSMTEKVLSPPRDGATYNAHDRTLRDNGDQDDDEEDRGCAGTRMCRSRVRSAKQRNCNMRSDGGEAQQALHGRLEPIQHERDRPGGKGRIARVDDLEWHSLEHVQP